MQKREDLCDLYFSKVADVGEWNYADYLVSRGIPIPAGWGVGQVIEGTVISTMQLYSCRHVLGLQAQSFVGQ